MPGKLPKYSPPRLARNLPRPRLIERLEKARDKRLLLILGQAAQGKSTLAAQYLQTMDEPCPWVNLGPEDSDPMNLFQALVRAILVATDSDASADLLQITGVSFGPRESIPLYREWAEALYSNGLGSMQICLDGVERLADDAPSYDLIKVLIEEAPPGTRYILLSRALPPLEIERMEMNQEAAVLHNRDLAFNEQEIRRYIKQVYHRAPTIKQARQLEELLEGWAGGLILYADLLVRSGVDLDKISEVGLGRQYLHKVFQYFAEQMFDALPPETRKFLVQTSIFEVIEPEMASALTGVTDAETILEGLLERNLFLVRYLNSGQGWLYRYHLLFRDFLKTKLKGEFPETERCSLVVKAAELLEAAGQPDEAVRLYFSINDFPRAARAIKTLGRRLIGTGRLDELKHWLEKLPKDIREADPRLALFWCRVRRYTATEENAVLLIRASEMMEAQNDIEGLLLAKALLIECAIVLGRTDEQVLESSEKLLAGLSPDEYRREQTEMLVQLGFFHVLRGDVQKGEAACSKAYRLATAAGIPELRINALIQGMTGRIYLGDVKGLRRDLDEIDKLGVTDYPELNTMRNFYQALFMSFYEGRNDEAVDLMQATLKEVETRGLLYLVMPAAFHYFITLIYARRYQKADAIIANWDLEMRQRGGHFVSLAFKMFAGIGKYHAGEYLAAIELLSEVRHALEQKYSRADTHQMALEFILQMSRLHSGLPVELERVQASLAYFEQIKSMLLTAEACLVLARYYHENKEIDRAKPLLSRAMKIMEECEYERFFMLSKVDTTKACCLALELCADPQAATASRILKNTLAEPAREYLKKLAQTKDSRVRDRARDTLLGIHLSGRPRLRLKLLGDFLVWRGDDLITVEDWGGTQPQLLLQALISLGTRKASKDTLMEALWPESPERSATQNFKTALHRLRSVLEPDLDRRFGSSYCLLKQNILSLSDLVMETDLEAFLRLATDGETAESAGRDREALSLYQQAEDLFSGPFLPDAMYCDWSRDRRGDVGSRFVGMMTRKARLHESRSAFRRAAKCYGRIIELDPTHEESYQGLMLLYFSRGKIGAALKAYKTCQDNLARYLDITPNDTTMALYKKIIN